jgi:hypothetical protein
VISVGGKYAYRHKSYFPKFINKLFEMNFHLILILFTCSVPSAKSAKGGAPGGKGGTQKPLAGTADWCENVENGYDADVLIAGKYVYF